MKISSMMKATWTLCKIVHRIRMQQRTILKKKSNWKMKKTKKNRQMTFKGHILTKQLTHYTKLKRLISEHHGSARLNTKSLNYQTLIKIIRQRQLYSILTRPLSIVLMTLITITRTLLFQ